MRHYKYKVTYKVTKIVYLPYETYLNESTRKQLIRRYEEMNDSKIIKIEKLKEVV